MLPGEAPLRMLLEPFAAQLARPDIREIVVNRPGRYRVEAEDGRHWHEDPRLTLEVLDAIGTLAASRVARRFDPGHPTFTGVLPDGQRIAAARSPAAPPGTVQLNIRCRALSFTPTLGWLADRGYFDDLPAFGPGWWQGTTDGLRSALICGAIGSSKTTMAEALLRALDHGMRLVTVEGSPEWLNLPHQDWAPLYFDGIRRSATDCIEDALRKRPDSIPFQEVTGPEAWALLRLGATGHHTVTTVHAPSCDEAIEALVLMAQQAPEARQLPPDLLRKRFRALFSVVAHVARDGNRFRLKEVQA